MHHDSKVKSAPKYNISEIVQNNDLSAWAEKAGVKLKRAGSNLMGCCPFHAEKTPSFSIYEKNGKQRFKCFGCNKAGDVINFVEFLHGCDTAEALAILSGKSARDLPVKRGSQGVPKSQDKSKQIESARKLYHTAEPAKGSPVETYLEARGIDPHLLGVPKVLKFSRIKYWHNNKDYGPQNAMLAPIINRHGKITGLHITYLNAAGDGKLALHDFPAKKIRGQCSGGWIPLSELEFRGYFAEGIETALACRQSWYLTHGEILPICTNVSLGNLARLDLPVEIDEVVILADNDMKRPRDPNMVDPYDILRDAQARLKAQGRKVHLSSPPAGMDFNDLMNEAGQ